MNNWKNALSWYQSEELEYSKGITNIIEYIISNGAYEKYSCSISHSNLLISNKSANRKINVDKFISIGNVGSEKYIEISLEEHWEYIGDFYKRIESIKTIHEKSIEVFKFFINRI